MEPVVEKMDTTVEPEIIAGGDKDSQAPDGVSITERAEPAPADAAITSTPDDVPKQHQDLELCYAVLLDQATSMKAQAA